MAPVHALALLLAAVATTGAPPGANPAQIDPMDPSVGDFLDIDPGIYRELGYEACGDGDVEMAARYFLAYLTRRSGDADVIYSLACCYGLLGEAELAAVTLDRAFAAGFGDIDLPLTDPDFDLVRDHPAFREATAWIDSAAACEPPDFDGIVTGIEYTSVLPCLYRLPEGYDDSTAVPLVIGLHGYGDSPENFMRLWNRFDSPEFVFACPRGPYVVQGEDGCGWSWFLTTGEPWEQAATDRHAVDLVTAVIDSISARHRISHVFVLGFSQGCALALMTGLHEPGRFDGIVGLGGRLHPSIVPGSVPAGSVGLPAFVANGTDDEKAPPTYGAQSAAILEEHGFDVTLRTWNGGHRLYGSILSEVEDWIEGIASEVSDGDDAD